MKRLNVIVAAICAALVLTTCVLGTLAYLTDRDTVVNTFTVGNVAIVLNESAVTEEGVAIDGAARVKENTYHLVPGKTYTKDPTLTVRARSEDAYVRILLSINCATAFDEIYAPDRADLTTIFNGYASETWIYETVTRTNDILTYEFRYKEPVTKSATDTVLEALFESFTVPSTYSGADMASLADLKITLVGHAIQASGFASEDAAWAAFETQA